MLYNEFFSRLVDKDLKSLLDKEKNVVVNDYFDKVINPLYNKLDLNKDCFCLVIDSFCWIEIKKHLDLINKLGDFPVRYFIFNWDNMEKDLERKFK